MMRFGTDCIAVPAGITALSWLMLMRPLESFRKFVHLRRSTLKFSQLIWPVAGLLAAIPLIASAASPTEVELAKAWQSRFDAKLQAVLKDPARNKDPLGIYRSARTYTKVRAINCQPQVENEIFCACEVKYTQGGNEKKDVGGIYLVKFGSGWVAKPE